MENDKWSWFAGGVLLGCLLGLGIAGGYAYTQLAREHEKAERLAIEVERLKADSEREWEYYDYVRHDEK